MKIVILSADWLSSFRNKLNGMAFAAVTVFFALTSPSGFAEITSDHLSHFLSKNLPGIVAPSLPAFLDGVTVSYSKISSSTRVLSATYAADLGTQKLVYPNKVFSVKDTVYTLNAKFNSSNVFQSGTVSMQGTISGLGINSLQTLMTADLTAFGKGYGGYVIGFNTSNIQCNPLINAYNQCTKAESITMALGKSFNFQTDYKAKGYALTSVPVPAAVWLFGSGLMGLVGVARRTKRNLCSRK